MHDGADQEGAATVTVRLFAGVRERARASCLTVGLRYGMTLGEALDEAARLVPGEWRVSQKVLLAVNGEFASTSRVLAAGDEIAVIPPVSGGGQEQRMLVEITAGPIDVKPLLVFVASPEDGAVVTFYGITRGHNDGRRVNYLEYEAYRPMAERKLAEIVAEMQERWEIGRVAVAHRTGKVDIGETSMVLAVAAPHRRPAFESALYFVDRLKETVPIWKKEYFEGGDMWIGETPGSGNPAERPGA